MGNDTVEMGVTRPPSKIEALRALSREYFLYCPDAIHQGSETMEALAEALVANHAWYFWWD